MISILFLGANPDGTARLTPDDEYEAIKAGLGNAKGGEHFVCVREPKVTKVELLQILSKHKPHVIHFSGHGTPQGYLLFEDDMGMPEPIAGETLADLLRSQADAGQRVRCIVLNACYTDRLAEDLAGVTTCVVGMTDAIADSSSVAFAVGFYSAIGTDANVQAAVEAGRNQIRLTRGARKGDWDLPRVRSTAVDTQKYVISRDREAPSPHATESLLHDKYEWRSTYGTGPIAWTDQMVDHQLGRTVVVKTLIREASAGHFRKEIDDLVRVSKHPNIVSIYESWQKAQPPHYIREHIEGKSLRHLLDNGSPPSIDFIHQVLASVGAAMAFAMRAGVWDLGVAPEKVLIQERPRGSTNHIVICPGPGGTDYIRSSRPQSSGEWGPLYTPPEYGRPDPLTEVDAELANQYRLGIIGYELLIGSNRFRTAAEGRSDRSEWPPIDSDHGFRRCPTFLRTAIQRMILRDPGSRYQSFDQAIEAVSHRNLFVEVARDSFARILDQDDAQEMQFFYEFYTALINHQEVAPIFGKFGPLTNPPSPLWQKQFDLLKEAIVLLFAYSLLRETQGRTILSRIAEFHCGLKGMRREYFEIFRIALIDTVVKFDESNEPHDLRAAWSQAIGPGLDYLMRHMDCGRLTRN